MSIPCHRPFCKTQSFPTSCWDCQQPIFIVRCSCGSTVLFDHAGPPWPKHRCPGWRRTVWRTPDPVPGRNTPVSSNVVTKQGGRKTRDLGKVRPGGAARSVDPQSGRRHISSARVSTLNADTDLTRLVRGILRSGLRPFCLDPRMRYWQITLVDSNVRPRESYIALIPDGLARRLRTNLTVKAEVCGRSFRGVGCWIVTDISPS